MPSFRSQHCPVCRQPLHQSDLHCGACGAEVSRQKQRRTWLHAFGRRFRNHLLIAFGTGLIITLALLAGGSQSIFPILFGCTALPYFLWVPSETFRSRLATARIIIIGWFPFSELPLVVHLLVILASALFMAFAEPQWYNISEEPEEEPEPQEFHSRRDQPDKNQKARVKIDREMKRLRKLLAEERKRVKPTPRSAARVQLLETALANQTASLAALKAQVRNRKLNQWLMRWNQELDLIQAALKSAKTTPEELDSRLREISLLEKSGQKLLKPGDNLSATHCLTQELTHLAEVRENLHDRRVLTAVGDSALPLPAFLLPEKNWALEHDGTDSLDKDLGEGEYHQIQGQLRVIKDSDPKT